MSAGSQRKSASLPAAQWILFTEFQTSNLFCLQSHSLEIRWSAAYLLQSPRWQNLLRITHFTHNTTGQTAYKHLSNFFQWQCPYSDVIYDICCVSVRGYKIVTYVHQLNRWRCMLTQWTYWMLNTPNLPQFVFYVASIYVNNKNKQHNIILTLKYVSLPILGTY